MYFITPSVDRQPNPKHKRLPRQPCKKSVEHCANGEFRVHDEHATSTRPIMPGQRATLKLAYHDRYKQISSLCCKQMIWILQTKATNKLEILSTFELCDTNLLELSKIVLKKKHSDLCKRLINTPTNQGNAVSTANSQILSLAHPGKPSSRLSSAQTMNWVQNPTHTEPDLNPERTNASKQRPTIFIFVFGILSIWLSQWKCWKFKTLRSKPRLHWKRSSECGQLWSPNPTATVNMSQQSHRKTTDSMENVPNPKSLFATMWCKGKN